MNTPTIQTPRLLLRAWKNTDTTPFYQLNQDPKVLEFLPGPLTKSQTQDWIQRIQQHFENHGFGLWAVELKETGAFMGYIGLQIPSFQAHFTPCVEIGWRLNSHHWGKGYATEGANAVLQWAWENTSLREIISFTVPQNRRSLRVIEKIGMERNPEDNFLHPKLAPDHRLAQHVLYRTQRAKHTLSL